jgi:hypothetical protein
MMNWYTGSQTQAYNEWLHKSREQAQKDKREKTLGLAACLRRANWLLADSSESLAYKEFDRRANQYAAGFLISTAEMDDAHQLVKQLERPEVIKLSNRLGLFSSLAPDLVLVADVMLS